MVGMSGSLLGSFECLLIAPLVLDLLRGGWSLTHSLSGVYCISRVTGSNGSWFGSHLVFNPH